jgi:hypothetical protein
MHSKLASLGAALALATTGCLVAPVVPPVGVAFTQWNAPLDPDYEETKLGAKVGKASTVSILGLLAFGDASAATAARAGGVTTIRHADYEYLNVLGIYQSFTIVVRGD